MSEPKSAVHTGHDHGCCAAPVNEKPHGAGPDQAMDPVHGMTVDLAKTPHHADMTARLGISAARAAGRNTSPIPNII